MAEHEDHRKFVPTWDGNPIGYKAYKDSVRIWLLGEKLDVEYSLAARLVQNLSGSARTLGNSMLDEELMPDPVPTGDGEEPPEHKKRRLLAGIDRLLKKLEQLRPEGPVRKGMTMFEFFRSTKWWRRPQERIHEYMARFDMGVKQLFDDGVDLSTIPDLLGCFFFVMMNLKSVVKDC